MRIPEKGTCSYSQRICTGGLARAGEECWRRQQMIYFIKASSSSIWGSLPGLIGSATRYSRSGILLSFKYFGTPLFWDFPVLGNVVRSLQVGLMIAGMDCSTFKREGSGMTIYSLESEFHKHIPGCFACTALSLLRF